MVNNSVNDSAPYDAILMVSFGGPEGRDDVIPFLENVLRGKNVPRERLLAVAEHYYHFDGISPINAQNRALIDALEQALSAHEVDLPIYWGNRNWYPMLSDTMQQMKQDGIQHALAFFTSAYSSYSGCRQYREDIARAQEAVGEGATQVSVLRKFYNHPGFIQPNVEHVQAALAQIPAERRTASRLVFTAHSIPLTMARNSMYEAQLQETCRLVAQGAGIPTWKLVYQSRSGSPHQPWLEPDILEHLRSLKAEGVQDVVIAPIGFISDHMEVLYDLDTEAQQLGQEIGLNVVRAATVGTHPQFIELICELIIERMTGSGEKSFLGVRGPSHDVCPDNCCLLGIEQPPKAKVEPA
jgi:protoporphyrin/coproporphyrin ferrochelatase